MDLQRITQFGSQPFSRSHGMVDRLDLKSSGSGANPYIIMPPKDSKAGGLFKSIEASSRIQVVESYGIKVKEELGIIGGYMADLTDKQVKELEKRGFRVVPDEQDRFLPPMPWERQEEEDESAGATGKAPKEDKELEEFKPRPQLAEPRFNSPLLEKFQGEGVTIAVIDTGLYPHPDFVTPVNRVVAFVDFVEGRTIPYDDNGHGTHVAGDAAGSGLLSGGLYRGAASKANLVGIKVLGADGSGTTSDIIKGIQFAIEHKDDLNIRVINLSLGHKAKKKYEDDPVDQAVKAAHDAGIVVMAAAGNDGPDRKTICAPGDSPFVVTVGAADDSNTADRADDFVAEFSSRGPTLYGASKPDLVAPGVSIMAPMAPGTAKEGLGKQFSLMHETLAWLKSLPAEALDKVPVQQFALMGLAPDTISKIKSSYEGAQKEFNRLLHATSRIPIEDGAYQGLPGTSMATPIVSGVVAAMLEANPDLTPDQVKTILTETADPLPDKRHSKNSQGAGMLDAQEAMVKALTTTGELVHPSEDDKLEAEIRRLLEAGAVLIGGNPEGGAPEKGSPEGGAPEDGQPPAPAPGDAPPQAGQPPEAQPPAPAPQPPEERAA
ncbi:MAG: S8 family peptidase [Armatimonadetes bacterium]|nr:S8 family peptidase [Armatimonadota bacterium]